MTITILAALVGAAIGTPIGRAMPVTTKKPWESRRFKRDQEMWRHLEGRTDVTANQLRARIWRKWPPGWIERY